jgi:hypothetical protein
MSVPGFTAEASLRNAGNGHPYRTSHARAGRRSRDGLVTPSLQQSTAGIGCGGCTETKWPNGTGTGSCVQDCCDALGNCKITACPCSGSGSGGSDSSGWSARSFRIGPLLMRF